MKKVIETQSIALIAGALLVIPSLYFIISALLNSTAGIAGPWSLIEPIFEQPGNKKIGFNVNLLILLGPLLAILLNLPCVMHASFSNNETDLNITLQFKKSSGSWMVISGGLFCLVSLFLYLFFENCKC